MPWATARPVVARRSPVFKSNGCGCSFFVSAIFHLLVMRAQSVARTIERNSVRASCGARFVSRFRACVVLRVDRHAMPEDQLAAQVAGDRNQDDAQQS